MDQSNFNHEKKLVNNLKENISNNKVLVVTSTDKSKENDYKTPAGIYFLQKRNEIEREGKIKQTDV